MPVRSVSDPLPEIGWCHNCQTYQFLRDAPWLESPYAAAAGEPTGGRVPCCVVCGPAEPWALGVHDASPAAAKRPVPGRFGVFLAKTCARLHAERQDSHYPGDCDCEPVEVKLLPVVVTWCLDCRVSNVLRMISHGDRLEEWQADRSRPCEHAQDHEQAATRAVRNRSGRSRSGRVTAEVSDWR